jgi:hypothetical protein
MMENAYAKNHSGMGARMWVFHSGVFRASGQGKRKRPRRDLGRQHKRHCPPWRCQTMTRRAADDRLFLTEGEIALKVGVGALDWQAAAYVLEKSGLPRPDPLFGQRRYWPAVRAFLDRRAGMAQSLAPLTRDGEEKWDDDRGRKSRARP